MSQAALYKEPGSRLPAAASCLGRHAHPAGRSPNSSSLFLPLAAVVAVAQGLFPAGLFGGSYELRLPLFPQPLGRALKKRSAAPASPPCFRRRRRSAPLLFESTLAVPFFKADKAETPVPIGYRSSWWARVDCASRAAKNSPLGCFCAVFCDSAAAVRIHPCSPFCKTDKTETPVPIGYRSPWWARVDSNHRS